MRFFLYALLVLATFSSCKPDLKSILGTDEIDFDNKVYSKSTFAGFTGEGYDFTIHKLSKKTINDFLNNENKSAFPKLLDNDKGRSVEKWSKTPLKKEDILELILSNYTEDSTEKEYIESLRKALANTDNYYSYYFEENESAIYAIEFYLIETDSQRLYIFENTL